MWYEWNVPPVDLGFSVYPIPGGVKPILYARNDCLFDKQFFYDYQNDEQHH